MDLRQVMQQAVLTPGVQRRLRSRGAQVAARVQALAAREGLRETAADIRVEVGLRPGTDADGFRRPYVRVVAPHAGEVERGTSRYDKYRLMARAARGTR